MKFHKIVYTTFYVQHSIHSFDEKIYGAFICTTALVCNEVHSFQRISKMDFEFSTNVINIKRNSLHFC